MSGIRRSWVLVAAFLAACEGGTEPHVPELRVPDVTLEARGDTARLTALSDGESSAAEWESLDPSIVTVTADGLATAVGAGTAEVRATVDGVVETGTVLVMPPIEIRVTELAVVTDPSGREGMSMRIQNLGGRGYYRIELWKHDPDGSKRRILRHTSEMEAEPGLDIEHRSFLSDEAADWVLAYSREPLADEAVRTSCTRLDGEPAPCPSDLPDPPAAVDSVTVWPAAGVYRVGDTVQFVARAFSGDVELTGLPVVWSTPTPDVISLSETGVGLALSSGYGQVEATVEGITGAVALTVESEEPGRPGEAVAFVHVAPVHLRLWVGQGWSYQASAYDAAGRHLEGATFSWIVEDSSIARVDSAGSVTAVGNGRTRVVAIADGVQGYALVDSYAPPSGGAELEFLGLLSAAHDGSTVEPSIDTTWVDSAGVTHDAWIQVRPGHLAMRWDGGTGRYDQRLVLSTYIYIPGEGARKVAESDYRDQGTLQRWWDYGTGREHFDFASETTDGLTYRATWSIPGELAVEQTVGATARRSYYFRLPL